VLFDQKYRAIQYDVLTAIHSRWLVIMCLLPAVGIRVIRDGDGLEACRICVCNHLLNA